MGKKRIPEHLQEFWVVRIHGWSYRIGEDYVTKIIEASSEIPKDDTSVRPIWYTISDIFSGAVIIDLKAVSSFCFSTPELREVESNHTDYLNEEFQEY